LRRLKEGHSYRGQGSGPATTNSLGCILPVKAVNRAEHGYLQMAPAVLAVAHHQEPTIAPQLAHRVACYIYKSAVEVQRMLYGNHHASHLCANERCINPDHLVIEPKAMNESRKECSSKLHIVTTIQDQQYILPAKACTHVPACLIKAEQRDAIKLEQE